MRWSLIFLVLILSLGAGAAQLVFETDFSSDPGIVSAQGDWVVEGGYLVNRDISHLASNVYIKVPQSGRKVIYEYKVTYEQTTAAGSFGPLGGLIFMVEDPEVKYDSYFLYGAHPFLKFVKTGLNDDTSQFTTAWTDARFAVRPGDTVEYRIEFDLRYGEILVLVNGEEAPIWEDYDPTLRGDYVSFRTNSTIMKVHYLRVYVEK